MKRSRIGDVYSIMVPNGYKLFQRAYDIPRVGRFIRVFDGLYDSIPENVSEIVAGPHSYIIDFHSSKAYRNGLSQLIGNYHIPSEYPFPEFKFSFIQYPDGKIAYIDIMRTNGTMDDNQSFHVSKMEDLPSEYRNLKLLNSYIPAAWVLYLFDTNWNPSQLHKYYPGLPGEDFTAKLQVYTKMIKDTAKHDSTLK